MGNRAYKTLRTLVLAGSVATSVGGCLSPAFMTYGAAITNPGNAHLARAHGFAVLGDETNRLLNRERNNVEFKRRNYINTLKQKEWYSYMKELPPRDRVGFLQSVIHNGKMNGTGEQHIDALITIRDEEIRSIRMEEERNSRRY